MTFHYIPVNRLYEKLKETTNSFTIPLVSVGSGNGAFEFEIKDLAKREDKDIEIICVDPAPESFRKYPENGRYIAPTFSTIEELLRSRPQIHGSCVLFIGWASYGNSTYDINAIETLMPLKVISLYEKEGGAGGREFHNFVSYVDRFLTDFGSPEDNIKYTYVLDYFIEKDVSDYLTPFERYIAGCSTIMLIILSLVV